MKHKILLIPALLLTACAGGARPIDGKSFLSGLEGPKVPTVQNTLLDSAKSAEKQGDFRQAAQFYQQVLEKSPDDKTALLGLADSTRRSGEPDKSISAYDALLAKDPANLDAKEGKSLALIAKGDFDTPTPLLESVFKADPKRWKTLNALGILFATRNLTEEAQAYFDEALKFNPDSPSVLNNAGLAQALNRRPDAAIQSLTYAATLAPVDSPERKRIHLNTAAVYASAGKVDEAKAIAEKYFTGAELNNNLGLYAHLAKNDELAKTYLNMALTESKTYYPKAWENLENISGNGGTVPQPADAPATVPAPVPSAETKPAPAMPPAPDKSKIAPALPVMPALPPQK